MKARIGKLLNRVVNSGFYKRLEVYLEDLARMPDADIDEDLYWLLEELCSKLLDNKLPAPEQLPRLRKLLDELCGVRLPRLRLRFQPPSTKTEPEPEPESTSEPARRKKPRL